MNGFRVVLLDMEWKLLRNDPFYIFLRKTFQFNQFYGENCRVFKLPLIRTVLVLIEPLTINTHIYLGMFEFIFGQ